MVYQRLLRKICYWVKYHNQPLQFKKYILFELWLIMIFSPVANFAQQSLFLFCYFKKHFKPCFFILKALKDILKRFKFLNWSIHGFVFLMNRLLNQGQLSLTKPAKNNSFICTTYTRISQEQLQSLNKYTWTYFSIWSVN